MGFLERKDGRWGLCLEGVGVMLRPPQKADGAQWLALRNASRDFLSRWEPQWPQRPLALDDYREWLERRLRAERGGTGQAFLIFDAASGRLAGGMNINRICRGVQQSCALGYWLGQPFAGRGLMTAAMGLVLAHVFEQLGLRRVEAACLPENTASRRLLRKSGFQEEGLLRQYLCINGQWRDHVMHGLLRGDWVEEPLPLSPLPLPPSFKSS